MAYVTPSTTTVGAVGLSADQNIMVNDVIYLHDTLPYTISVVQPSRAKDTVYQNTSGKIRMVNIVITCPPSAQGRAYIGTSTSPNIEIAAGYISAAGGDTINASLAFPVPPSYYYKLTEISATVTVVYWVECDLH